jgi:D-alanyl-D-alanine carboxypeptidase (penicillin-binding protein 5/6)
LFDLKGYYRAALVVLLLVILLLIATLPVGASGPAVSADAAFLMDAQTGTALYAKDAYTRRPPASTTKIMVGIVALEIGNLRDVVTISRRAAYTEGSSMYLKEGENVTLEDLIYGALMQSGNDACVAIGEHLCGSEDVYVELMNRKAQAIGAWDTNFKNPHGLPADGHYSTAFDLALLARYALRNEKFQEIVKTKIKTVAREDEVWGNVIQSTNSLLWDYEGADGVKTGTTAEAGQCLVASATRGGRQLIAVVLNSSDRWVDAVSLLDYGFQSSILLSFGKMGDQVTQVEVAQGKEEKVDLVLARDLDVVVAKEKVEQLKQVLVLNESLAVAPLQQGEVLGEMQVHLEGKVMKRVALVAAKEVQKRSFLQSVFPLSL